MKTDNSKLIIGLVVGTAIGAAIGCFLASDKKDVLFEEIAETVDKAKGKIGKAVNKGIVELEVAVDKVNAIAQSAISRAKTLGEEAKQISDQA